MSLSFQLCNYHLEHSKGIMNCNIVNEIMTIFLPVLWNHSNEESDTAINKKF